MTEWLQIAINTAQDRWHSRTGLAVALASVAAVFIGAFAGIDITEVLFVEWLIVFAACAVMGIVWWVTRLPRVMPGRIGFGLAIQYEDSQHAKQLRSDFVLTLGDLITSTGDGNLFQFIELPISVARRILSADEATRFAKQCRLHFLLYGRARMRDLPGGASHVIDLRGVVCHAPIREKWSQKLGAEFGAVLPNRLLVAAEGDVFNFQFAAKHIDAVSLYVIGTAAFLSNDLKLAEQLLVDAESRLRAGITKADGFLRSVLRDRVRRRITEVYKARLARQTRRHTITRDVAAIQEAEEIIANLRQYAHDDYDVHLAAAMAAFALHRDMETARMEIRACRNSPDAAWRYSEAFLYAYDGDLQRAYESYRRAFDSPLADPTVPTQCEEFIQGIVEEEPERQWLYYCLGLINYRGKGDPMAALSDLRKFVDEVDTVRFAKYVGYARRWIDEIEKANGRHKVGPE